MIQGIGSYGASPSKNPAFYYCFSGRNGKGDKSQPVGDSRSESENPHVMKGVRVIEVSICNLLTAKGEPFELAMYSLIFMEVLSEKQKMEEIEEAKKEIDAQDLFRKLTFAELMKRELHDETGHPDKDSTGRSKSVRGISEPERDADRADRMEQRPEQHMEDQKPGESHTDG